CLRGEVDVAPCRVPRLVEDELRDVVQEVPVDRAAPIEDGGDPTTVHEHVAVDEIVMDEVAGLRAEIDQLAHPSESVFELPGPDRRSREQIAPTRCAAGRRTGLDAEQPGLPGRVRRGPGGTPAAETRPPGQIDG